MGADNLVAPDCFIVREMVELALQEVFGSSIYVSINGSSFSLVGIKTVVLRSEANYKMYATDFLDSGRTPEYTITIDRTVHIGTLYADSYIASSGSITNASFVTYRAMDNFMLDTIMVQRPNSSVYSTTTSGTEYTADGKLGDNMAGDR